MPFVHITKYGMLWSIGADLKWCCVIPGVYGAANYWKSGILRAAIGCEKGGLVSGTYTRLTLYMSAPRAQTAGLDVMNEQCSSVCDVQTVQCVPHSIDNTCRACLGFLQISRFSSIMACFVCVICLSHSFSNDISPSMLIKRLSLH